MNFDLNEDQKMIEGVVERFASDHYQPGQRAAYRAMPGGYSADNWKLLAELGIFGLLVDGGGPDDVGGGPVETMVVMQALGRALAIEPVLNEIVLAGRLLAAAATAAQREAWLDPLLAGEAHLGFAFAEHNAHWSLERVETRFESGRLTGRKTFGPSGADAFVVTARDGDAVRLFLAPAKSERIKQRDYRLVDGALASEIEFQGADAEPLGLTLQDVQPVLDQARLAASAEMLGICEFALATTVEYVKTRHQFGKPIGSFQALQHRLADLYVQKEQSRSLLFRAVLADAATRPSATAAAKAYISRVALRLTEQAIQMHGGMGISSELEIGTGLKRVLVLSTLFGDANVETRRYNALLAA